MKNVIADLKKENIKIIDRRGKANGGNPRQRSLSNITRAGTHWTATAREGEEEVIEGHENYWRNTLGWNFGGYHIYVPRTGAAILNYDFETQTNGVGNHNSNTVHVSYEGNPANPMNTAQRKALMVIFRAIPKDVDGIKSTDSVLGHNEFSGHATNQCPGIDMNDFRQALKDGHTPNVQPKPAPEQPQTQDEAAVPTPTGQQLHLPPSVDTWNIYNPNGPYTRGNEIHKLTPSAFPNGITYDIKGSPVPNVYLIDTQVRGRVAIYAGPDTSARITGGNSGGSQRSNGRKLHLPPSVQTWRIYRENGPYTVGNEIHKLTPAAFSNGITYDILEDKGNGVYIINTQVRGRVAIFADPNRTAATIS